MNPLPKPPFYFLSIADTVAFCPLIDPSHKCPLLVYWSNERIERCPPIVFQEIISPTDPRITPEMKALYEKFAIVNGWEPAEKAPVAKKVAEPIDEYSRREALKVYDHVLKAKDQEPAAPKAEPTSSKTERVASREIVNPIDELKKEALARLYVPEANVRTERVTSSISLKQEWIVNKAAELCNDLNFRNTTLSYSSCFLPVLPDNPAVIQLAVSTATKLAAALEAEGCWKGEGHE